jgi:hypothetical protein
MHRESNMVQGYIGVGRYTNLNSEPSKHALKYPILADENKDQQAKTEHLLCFPNHTSLSVTKNITKTYITCWHNSNYGVGKL